MSREFKGPRLRPDMGELRRDNPLVGDVALQDAEVARELVHAGDERRARSMAS